MRNVTADTITEAVLQTIADTTEPRLRQIMTSLIRHLHAFAREVELTPDEWMAAMEFLVRVGRNHPNGPQRVHPGVGHAGGVGAGRSAAQPRQQRRHDLKPAGSVLHQWRADAAPGSRGRSHW